MMIFVETFFVSRWFSWGQWTPSTFANFFLYEATGTSHETYTLTDFPAIICGRVPSGVVSHSRRLFMEGRKTTLLIIKLEHTTVLYRRLVLKQFGTSMMM